jgi:hypothetical protein
MTTSQAHSLHLPIKRNLAFAYILSLIIVLLMTASSIAGLIYQTTIYPSDELRQTFLPNDVVNLAIGVPILLISMWLTRRGKLIGLLFWPGALFYVFYNYIAYVFGMPFNIVLPLNLALATLSVYTTIGLIASTDGNAIKDALNGKVSERFGGGVVAGFGILFAIRVFVVMVGALTSQAPIAATEFPVLIADFMVSPAFIIGGVLLWQRRVLGYLSGLGLLFQASMLFIGLIIFMLIQPLLTTASFPLFDMVVVAVMGLICFIPFGRFVRGVLATEKKWIQKN